MTTHSRTFHPADPAAAPGHRQITAVGTGGLSHGWVVYRAFVVRSSGLGGLGHAAPAARRAPHGRRMRPDDDCITGSRPGRNAQARARRERRNPAIPWSSWLAMNAPGTMIRISWAWLRQAHTVCPPESASFTSALFRQAVPPTSVTWQVAVVPPRASTRAAASFSRENRGEISSSADSVWETDGSS
jgi:hypothetical protein